MIELKDTTYDLRPTQNGWALFWMGEYVRDLTKYEIEFVEAAYSAGWKKAAAHSAHTAAAEYIRDLREDFASRGRRA